MIRTKRTKSSRICQGEIIRDVEFIESVDERRGVLKVSRVIFPLAVVLTQDCDLESEDRARRNDGSAGDKTLVSVLMAPLYNAEHVFQGLHLSELKIQSQPVPKKGNSGDWLKDNQRPRYHYLDFPADVPVVPSVIDFKHYFSVTLDYLLKARRTRFVCTISPLYRERLTQRFAEYLARIGLPNLKEPVAIAGASPAQPAAGTGTAVTSTTA
jgi:hypothetical protein